MSEPTGVESVIVIDDDYAMRISCDKILSKMGLAVEVVDNMISSSSRSRPPNCG